MEGRILIVDDEKPVLSYLAAVLDGEGYSVVAADSGASALELIKKKDLDLVLCDMMMANVNGLQVLEQVREAKPDIAFILMTAYASVRSAITALRRGASDYIVKPFEDEELRLRVKSAVEKRAFEKRYDARTRELEAVVFTISHDLAGHLLAMRGFARRLLIRHGDELSGEARGYLDRMGSSAERMEKVVAAISDFARAGTLTGKVEMVDMNKMVQEVLQDFQAIIEEKEVNVRVASSLPTVQTEWINAYQVFHNLIGNALKFSRRDIRLLIEISAEEIDQHYQFCVRDNGIGVRREDKERIFEMFGRGGEGREVPGTGLGLAIVKRIIEKGGGTIWVESEEERGSVFYFTFPKRSLAQAEAAREKPASSR